MKTGLRKLAVLMSPRLSRGLTCEACGNAFTCGASLSGCWCAEISLSDELRTELKSRYRDCLCRDCLERFAQTAHPNS